VIPLQFSDPASEDLAEAVRWYDQQRSGLGAELLGAVSEAIDQIRTHHRKRHAEAEPPSDQAASRFEIPVLGCLPSSRWRRARHRRGAHEPTTRLLAASSLVESG